MKIVDEKETQKATTATTVTTKNKKTTKTERAKGDRNYSERVRAK